MPRFSNAALFHICLRKRYNNSMKKILFCGGGSAGHVIPNIALIEELSDRYEVFYAGTDGIEREICNKFKITFYSFDGVKLVRGAFFKNISIPFKLIKSIKQAQLIIDKTNPDLVFCKGGYASLPPAIAAKKRKIKVLTHESDLSLGLANKIISKFAEKTLCAFSETAKKTNRGKYAGTPMRRAIFKNNKIEAKNQFGLDARPTIIVFGGGSGSKKINQAIRKAAKDICKDYNILHICGKENITNLNIYGYKQIEFCDNMGDAYACADYAVARCGSNSAHELIALKIPTLFIPLENSSSRGDQVANAEYLKKRCLCAVLREDQLNSEKLTKEIYELIENKNIKAALAESECGNGNVAIINEITKALQ